MQHVESRRAGRKQFGENPMIVKPYIGNGGGLKLIGSEKVPCITASYHNGFDGFGTRPYLLENGNEE